ncbi:unnamed protein product [Adineta steineri]|uniref:Uncharacterized protein n=1 Tax=Adineta steineri TaxID=433720 RepID=A0A819CCV3_9BILA|nr:unnamed protein product [Adineta steineri]CAF3810384.1 unnamed protein product [Adineta steineri]
MICNYFQFLLPSIMFICCCYFGALNTLDFVFQGNSFLRCSSYEYIVIKDWLKLLSSNVSCNNQTNRFPNNTVLQVYKSVTSLVCDDLTKQTRISSNITPLLPPSTKNKSTSEDIQQFRGTVNVDKDTYSFEPSLESTSSNVTIHYKNLHWSSNFSYTLYLTFDKQPIMCRIELNISDTVNNGKCVNDGAGKALIHCYYDPQSTSKLLLTQVNWTQLDSFRADEFYYASNWTVQGGYYINLLSLKTTSTSTTTSTTATTSTSTTTTVSVTNTTTTTSTSTTTTTTTTTVPVTTTTTTTSTSTTTTTTTVPVTTTTTTTSTSTTTTTTTTTPPVTSATTTTSTSTTTAPVATTTTTASTSTITTPLVTSTSTMTTKHQIITTSSIILSDTGTTFFKP